MIRSKLFKQWFMSYLLFTIISLIFIFQIYKLFGKSVEKEMNLLNDSFLTQIKTLIDGELNSLDELSSIINYTSEVQSVINIKEELSTKDRYNLLNVVKKLKLYSSSNDTIKSINIYVSNPNILITDSSMYPSNFIDLVLDEKFDTDINNFSTAVNGYFNREIIKFCNLNNTKLSNDKLIYLQSLPLISKDYLPAVLILEIDSDKISNYMNMNEYQKDGYICILDDKDRVVFSKGKALKIDDFIYNDIKNNQPNDLKIGNKDYILYSKQSNIKNWKYISVIPENICWEEADKLKNNTIFFMIGLLIINTILAYCFSSKNYKPLNKIVHKVKNEDEHIKDEYKFIENVIEQNIELQKRMKNKLRMQRDVLKNNFLINLLKGKIEDEKIIDEQLKLYNIPFKKGNYIVMVIKVNKYLNVSKNEIELTQFIIKNIVTEIFNNKFNSVMLDIDEFIAGIINVKDDSYQEDMFYSKVEDYLNKAYGQIKTNFEIDYITSISNLQKSLIGITEGYREALEAMAYTKILSDTENIFYSDTLKTNKKYSYPLEKEQQLINFIKLGNSDKAKEITNGIIDNHLRDRMLSLETFQCLIFDLLSSIIKAVNTEKEEKIFEDLKPIKSITNSDNIDSMKTILNNTLDKICKSKKEHVIEQDENSLHREILKYIKENYNDPNMNVSMIGDHFNMTPAYMSKLYKQKTGKSVLTTLNLIRIEESKKLLDSREYTVSQIALKMGFACSNAFIRVFKKYEGVTPGQYRIVAKTE